MSSNNPGGFERVGRAFGGMIIMQCPVCFALVSEERTEAHTAWHKPEPLPTILTRQAAAECGFPARPRTGDKHTTPDGSLYVYEIFEAGQWTRRTIGEQP